MSLFRRLKAFFTPTPDQAERLAGLKFPCC
jgi:hypothetical protein